MYLARAALKTRGRLNSSGEHHLAYGNGNSSRFPGIKGSTSLETSRDVKEETALGSNSSLFRSSMKINVVIKKALQDHLLVCVVQVFVDYNLRT